MSKAVRLLHLRIFLNLSKMFGRNWKDATRHDIDELVYKIMQKYASEDGQETNSSSINFNSGCELNIIYFSYVKTISVLENGEVKHHFVVLPGTI